MLIDLQCQIVHHNLAKIEFFCFHKYCQYQRFACAHCSLEHCDHNEDLISVEEFQNLPSIMDQISLVQKELDEITQIALIMTIKLQKMCLQYKEKLNDSYTPNLEEVNILINDYLNIEKLQQESKKLFKGIIQPCFQKIEEFFTKFQENDDSRNLREEVLNTFEIYELEDILVKKYQQQIKPLYQLILDDKYDEALQQCNILFEKNEKDLVASWISSIALRLTRQFDRAIIMADNGIKRITEIHQHLGLYFYNKGDSLKYLKNYNEAFINLEIALETSKNIESKRYEQLKKSKGEILIGMKRFDEGILILENCLKVNENYWQAKYALETAKKAQLLESKNQHQTNQQ